MKGITKSAEFSLVALLISAAVLATAGTYTSVEGPMTVGDVSASTINPDDGNEIILDMPNYEKCSQRKQGVYGVSSGNTRTSFWVSIVDPSQQVFDPDTRRAFNKTYTWIQARNKCRSKCMELVTLDAYHKNENLVNLLEYLHVNIGVWTSGKRCLADECASVPQPIHLNGWYWSTTEEKLHPADQTEDGWPQNPWSDFGVLGQSQPDNYENLADRSVIEACLAIQADPDTQKMRWNDVACDSKLGIVCEPAPKLVRYVEVALNVTLA
ncbi:C-type lectin fold [Trinorchestia longiramus]|nr:C-type lectin fold [Trinorchestia longiramus]